MRKNLKKNFSKKSLKKKSQNGGKKSKKNNKRVNKKSFKKGGGDDIVCSGWLRKRGGRPFFRWDWRWFVLKKDGMLEYYDRENGNLKGSRNVRNCTVVNLEENIKKTDREFGYILYGFAIKSETMKNETKNRGRGGEFQMHIGKSDDGNELGEMIKWILKISSTAKNDQTCDNKATELVNVHPPKWSRRVITFESNCNSELNTDCYNFYSIKNTKEIKCKPLYEILNNELEAALVDEQIMKNAALVECEEFLNACYGLGLSGHNGGRQGGLQANLAHELVESLKVAWANIFPVAPSTIHDKVNNQIFKKQQDPPNVHPHFLGVGSFNAAYMLNLQDVADSQDDSSSPQKKKVVLRLTHEDECSVLKNELKGLYYQTKISKKVDNGGLGCKNVCKVYDFGRYNIGKDHGLSFYSSMDDELKTHPVQGVYAFIEYLPGGELYKRINSDDWDNQSQPEIIKRTKKIIIQLLQALQCIHEAGYVYLDLKLENIMCVSNNPKDDSIKLIDFGFMGKIDTVVSSIRGSPGYMSSDFYDIILGGRTVRAARSFDERFDIWSIGILAWECIFGLESAQDLNALKYHPRHKDLKLVLCPNQDDYNNNKCPQELEKFLKKIFTPLNERPTAKKLLEDEFLMTEQNTP